jgi:hypothetical protein
MENQMDTQTIIIIIVAVIVLLFLYNRNEQFTEITKDGRCGPKYNNKICPGNQCCSKYGWCGGAIGTGSEWCSGTNNRGINDGVYDGHHNQCGHDEICRATLQGSKCRAIMQQDGNLVVYDGNNAVIWASNTNKKGVPPYRVTMQEDGNLVVYDGNNAPIWASNTKGKGTGPYKAIMQDDCNYVVYDGKGSPLWASNTAR